MVLIILRYNWKHPLNDEKIAIIQLSGSYFIRPLAKKRDAVINTYN